jgi:dsRNA-specific ribonuclease
LTDIADLQNALGINFKDISLLQHSLVHRSYINENSGDTLESNERLEYLGDAVLGFVVAEEILLCLASSWRRRSITGIPICLKGR